MKKYLIISLIGFILISCSTSKTRPPVFTEESNIEVISNSLDRDTTFQIPEETSSFIGKLSVDSSGKFQLEEISSSGTENVSEPQVKIIENYIEVDCEKKAQELFLEWKENHKHTIETRTVTFPVPVERDFTFWESIFLWLGRIFALLLFASLVILATKINVPFLKPKR
jgi:hypothetical protein